MQRAVERFPVGPPPRRRKGSKATSRSARGDRKGSDREHLAKLTSKQKIASQVYNLELDVSGLKQQIHELSLHRSLLHARVLSTRWDPDGSAVKTARDYFHTFRHGFRGKDFVQVNFVASVFDEDLSLGVTGLERARDVLVEQWRRYTGFFAIRAYDVPKVRVLASEERSRACVVRGEGVFRGSFTREALEIAFPAVLQDLQLTQELLGRELVTPVAFTLHFDERGFVVRHDGEVDWFAALAETLGSRVRAAKIMERVYVPEEGIIDVPPEDVRPPATTTVSDTKQIRYVVVEDEEESDDEDAARENARREVQPDQEPDDGPYVVSF